MLKYRSVCEADRTKLAESIALDPDHADRCIPDFWLSEKDASGQNVPGVQFFAVEDSEGTLGYIRAENVVRLHTQFCPQCGRERLARGIDEFIQQFRSDSVRSGYRQIIYDSTVAPLIRFLRKRGFRDGKNEHILDL